MLHASYAICYTRDFMNAIHLFLCHQGLSTYSTNLSSQGFSENTALARNFNDQSSLTKLL